MIPDASTSSTSRRLITRLSSMLSAPGQERLRALQQAADDARDLYRARSDERHNTLEHNLQIERRNVASTLERRGMTVDQALEKFEAGENLKDDELIRRLKKYQAALAERREFLARLQEIGDRSQHLRALVGHCHRYLETAGDRLKSTTIKLPKNFDPGEAIDKIRDLRADMLEVDAAPYPSAEAKAVAIAQITRLAEQGRPDVLGVIDHLDVIRWPSNYTPNRVAIDVDPGRIHSDLPDARPFIAWIMKDQLISKMTAEIDELADDKHALSKKDREARKASIADQILGLERQIAEHAFAAGDLMILPDDTDPRALLTVSGPAPREA